MGSRLHVCPGSTAGTGRACSPLPGLGLSLQETWGSKKPSEAADLLQLRRKWWLTEAENVTRKGCSGKISHFRRALEKRFDVMKMSHS